MKYTIDQIIKLINPISSQIVDNEFLIHHIVFDSRKISYPQHSIFIALKSTRDGHLYIKHAYDKGIRNFIVSDPKNVPKGCNIVIVKDVLSSLQLWAKKHKEIYAIQTISITGSNGKTIVKEWLSNILNDDYKLYKSPKSYNSQLGVALSLLNITPKHELAIIEAGISQSNEMIRLQEMIQPDIGLFTNIGDAHNAGFDSLQHKIEEKLILFKNSSVIIYCKDDNLLDQSIQLQYPTKQLFTWGKNEHSNIKIIHQEYENDQTKIKIYFKDEFFTLRLPFKDLASIENVMHAVTTSLFLEIDSHTIQDQVDALKPISLRFEIENGRNNTKLINDSYSIDFQSFKIAVEYLENIKNNKHNILIFTDFEQQNDIESIMGDIASLINEKNIQKVICVGDWINKLNKKLSKTIDFYSFRTTKDLLNHLNVIDFSNANILIKGARKFNLEKVFQKLSSQVHQTVLEINLNHIGHNIQAFKRKLKPQTKIIAVIKASAYGSGSSELAHYASQNGIDQFAVALVDEGIELRKAGIRNPIMVFNLQENAIDRLWEYGLETEIFSLNQLKSLVSRPPIADKNLGIHIKLDTGMRRLGFIEHEFDEMIQILKNNRWIFVKSIFSHLASSENQKNDDFTKYQCETFEQNYQYIAKALNISPPKHILNSSGIIRFPEFQMDMVRLGLGMYGINETDNHMGLKEAVALKTKILQIKTLNKGEATGYGREATAHKNTKIGIIGIGYADGLMRNSGNGKASVFIQNNPAPIIGSICMDVSIINLENHPDVKEGDEVIIFQNAKQIENLAKINQTISYEILSRIAPRVKRIYFEE